jgi:hypothetical protein
MCSKLYPSQEKDQRTRLARVRDLIAKGELVLYDDINDEIRLQASQVKDDIRECMDSSPLG